MGNLIAFVRDLLIRLKGKNPKLFATLQWVCGIVATILGILLSGNALFHWGWEAVSVFSITVTELFGYIITFLGGIFAAAQLTVSDNSQQKDKLKYTEPKITDIKEP